MKIRRHVGGFATARQPVLANSNAPVRHGAALMALWERLTRAPRGTERCAVPPLALIWSCSLRAALLARHPGRYVVRRLSKSRENG
jgi:hypothetical protein